MIMLAQVEQLIKPPQPGDSLIGYLVWALVLMLAVVVSAVLVLVNHLVRVWLPESIGKFIAALEKKDQALEHKDAGHAAAVTALEVRCEERANRRSDAHRKEMDVRTQQFLEALKEQRDADGKRWELAFGEKDVERVVRRRNRLEGQGGTEAKG